MKRLYKRLICTSSGHSSYTVTSDFVSFSWENEHTHKFIYSPISEFLLIFSYVLIQNYLFKNLLARLADEKTLCESQALQTTSWYTKGML